MHRIPGLFMRLFPITFLLFLNMLFPIAEAILPDFPGGYAKFDKYRFLFRSGVL